MAFDDSVVRSLGEALMPAFERPETANQLFVDYIALALMSHLTASYGERAAGLRADPACLTPRQERRAKEILLANMEGRIGLAELAREVGLSRSHFARAFKATTGLPPYRWLLARRLEHACELLLVTDLSLDSIASRCGFTDRSHFNRTFTKATGSSPSQWRRSRKS
jgi:AraC-like DNA-binding protein